MSPVALALLVFGFFVVGQEALEEYCWNGHSGRPPSLDHPLTIYKALLRRQACSAVLQATCKSFEKVLKQSIALLEAPMAPVNFRQVPDDWCKSWCRTIVACVLLK